MASVSFEGMFQQPIPPVDVRTEETEVMEDDDNAAQQATESAQPEDEDDEGLDQDQEEEDDDDDEASDEEQIESSVQADMDKLTEDFPGFRDKYRLIKRIGEGVFPSRYPLCVVPSC